MCYNFLMKKKLLIIVIILVLLIGNTIYINQSNINVRFETLSSPKIPTSLDEKTILFFSDIYYVSDYQENILNEALDLVNRIRPDIVIFGGNLIKDYHNNPINDEEIEYITQLFKEIEAPLGKFAILGHDDKSSNENLELYERIMFNANFEVISNESINLSNNSNNGITLTFVDNIDVDYSFNSNNYNLVISSNPNYINKLADHKVEYIITGATLGGEIYIPLITDITNNDFDYINGKRTINESVLDISSGIGNLNHNFRLFTNREIVLYTLNNEETKKEVELYTPLPTNSIE